RLVGASDGSCAVCGAIAAYAKGLVDLAHRGPAVDAGQSVDLPVQARHNSAAKPGELVSADAWQDPPEVEGVVRRVTVLALLVAGRVGVPGEEHPAWRHAEPTTADRITEGFREVGEGLVQTGQVVGEGLRRCPGQRVQSQDLG